MKSYNLYVDESEPNTLNVFSLTGLLIQSNIVLDLEKKFLSQLNEILKTEEAPPLHGVDFLRGHEGDKQIEVLVFIKNFCIENNIRIYRASNIKKASNKSFFESGLHPRDYFYSACWFGLMAILQPILNEHRVMPIFDNDESNKRLIDIISIPVKSFHETISRNPNNCSLPFNNNLEIPQFDKGTIFLQIVDVISYVLQKRMKRDYFKEKPSEFSLRLIDVINNEFNEIIDDPAPITIEIGR